MLFPAFFAAAQQSGSVPLKQGTIRGVALSGNKPVANATVRLETAGGAIAAETKTDATGNFMFSGLRAGGYRLVAIKGRQRSLPVDVALPGEAGKNSIPLVLQPDRQEHSSVSTAPMAFADTPNFTVAGITDWTAVGGHGSDSILRTSEALARQTLTLKPQGGGAAKISSHAVDANGSEAKLRAALAVAPDSFAANHALGSFYLHAGRYSEALPLLEKAHGSNPGEWSNEYVLAQAYEGSGDYKQALQRVNAMLAHHNRADLRRMAGDLNEKLGQPLAAVHEYQQAARLDPSEGNYFAWGSDLLLHRAVWQAQEVFREGVKAYPRSSRMLTALGTALFAGALYDKAALTLCEASDLNPSDVEPYIFMGKVELASPGPLPCIEAKLARFAREQPGNPLANYLYAMAILKRHQLSADTQATQQATQLLQKAVRLDSTCSEAYLELGILSYARRDVAKAIDFYQKAIDASPQLAESYYRLGVAYNRMGQTAKARREFQLHDELEKKQTAAVDSRRREIKQFLIVDPGKPAHPPAQ